MSVLKPLNCEVSIAAQRVSMTRPVAGVLEMRVIPLHSDSFARSFVASSMRGSSFSVVQMLILDRFESESFSVLSYLP